MKQIANHTPTFADAGTGVIDFARFFKAAEHEYVIERDDARATALTTAKVGYDFLSFLLSIQGAAPGRPVRTLRCRTPSRTRATTSSGRRTRSVSGTRRTV